MGKIHKDYLESRNFDPLLLQSRWSLLGTGAVSYIDDSDYKFRIVAPVNFNGDTVSFQGRDITDRHPHKYKACPEPLEIIPHKHVLYGVDKAIGDTAIVVEGITGVWRFGPGVVGTFGVKYTASQVRLIAERFQRIFLLFDPDEAGIRAADSLWLALATLGKTAIILDLPTQYDSGNLPQSEADLFIREIIK